MIFTVTYHDRNDCVGTVCSGPLRAVLRELESPMRPTEDAFQETGYRHLPNGRGVLQQYRCLELPEGITSSSVRHLARYLGCGVPVRHRRFRRGA